jgi:hypothetical protein
MTYPVTRYLLAKINLVKAACPHVLLAEAANMGVGRMIVVERNRKKLGYVEAADYFPPVVIVAGAETRSQLLKQGHIHGWALVERGAMDLSTREMMGSADVLSLLQEAITTKFYPRGIFAGQEKPVLVECYPFESRVVYAMKNQLFAQRYIPDFAERRINLIGHVIDACGMNTPMMPVKTGARYSPVSVFTPTTSSNRGAPNSELVSGIIRDWTDIEKAVRNYLGASRRASEVLRPAFEPVALKYGNDIVYRGDTLKHSLVKAGIDPIDFALWSVDAQQVNRRKVSR